MSSLRRLRIRALLARGLLGLWLFTVAQGAASACLLQRAVVDHAIRADSPISGVVHRHGAAEPAPSEAPCAKACDELQDSLPKKKPSWAADIGLVLTPVFSAWQPPAEAGLLDRKQAAPDRGPGLSIRFLRLTL